MSARDIQDFIAGVAPDLAARAADIEANRGLPADLARRLATGGVFHLLTPAAYGGLQLAPHEAYAALEALARAEMSAGWCAMIGSTSAMGLAWLDAATARALVPSRETVICGVAAPTGRAVRHGETYRATGQWSWASAGNFADHFMCGCVIADPGGSDKDGPPATRLLIFAADQVTRHDTWHVMGLSGTASGDIAVNDAEVPHARSYAPLDEPCRIDAPLYRFPYLSVLGLGVAAVALGNARAALDDIVELAGGKQPAGGRSKLAQKPYVQIRMADLFARYHAARAFFYDTVERTWEGVLAGRESTPEDRARLRLAAVHAGQVAAQVTRGCHELAGGTSVFSSHPLQRRLRDAEVATQHRMISAATDQLIGQTLLGLGSHELLDAARV